MRTQRIPLVFGSGVDRGTGIMAAPPGGFEELINVYVHQGKARARRGAEVASQLTDPTGQSLSDIVMVRALRAVGEGVVVGWRSADRKVYVLRTDGNGENAAHVPHESGTAEWFAVDANASEPPIVIGVETFGKMFLAHAEMGAFLRGPTVYYDPIVRQVRALTADLDGTGAAPIRFMGVTKHLEYLFGWGFGTENESRPEMVRVSLPGQPTEFPAENYFIVGTRGDPVISCVPLGDRLLVFKQTETHEIFGYSQQTFGVRPVDLVHGLLAPRLAVTVSGVCYYWTPHGPRAIAPGSSIDLEPPLDLGGPDPVDLVAEGSAQHAWAEYLPEQRAILFVFGRRVYVLNLRDPQHPRWTYHELGFEAVSAGLIYVGAALPLEPPGFNDTLSVSDIGPDSVMLHWKNRDMIGDELIEIWLRPAGGAWALETSVAVAAAVDQSYLLEDLDAGMDYDWALRAVRGGLYRAGYESPDPDTWPAESRSSFTTALLPPTIESATWERTAADSERIRLTITPVHAEADIRVYRDAALIATIPAPGNTDPLTFDDTTALGLVNEANHTYTVRSATAHIESADSAPVTRWAGPDAPANVVVDDEDGQSWYSYMLTWSARPEYTVEIEDDYQCLGTWAARATMPSEGDSGLLLLPKSSSQQDTGDNGIPAAFQTRIRHFLSSFGVVDHSEWVERSVVVRIADDETEYNACNGGGGGGGGGGGDDDPPPEET